MLVLIWGGVWNGKRITRYGRGSAACCDDKSLGKPFRVYRHCGKPRKSRVMNDALLLVRFDFVVGTDRIKRTHGGLLCLCDPLHKINLA